MLAGIPSCLQITALSKRAFPSSGLPPADTHYKKKSGATLVGLALIWETQVDTATC